MENERLQPQQQARTMAAAHIGKGADALSILPFLRLAARSIPADDDAVQVAVSQDDALSKAQLDLCVGVRRAAGLVATRRALHARDWRAEDSPNALPLDERRETNMST